MKLNLKIKGKPYKTEKLTRAAELAVFAIATPEFKSFVLNHEYTVTECTGALWWKRCKQKTYKKFHYTNLNNQQVLDKILSGSEDLSPEKDGEFDIEIEVDHKYRRGVIGYTYPAIPTQYIYKWFLDSADVYDVAGNVAHEMFHKLGFDHEFNYTVAREFSVPYSLGYWVENYLRKNKL